MGLFGLFGNDDREEEERSERLEELHNQGQEDASQPDPEYNDPHPVNPMTMMGELLESQSDSDRREEENEAYRSGWDHGWKQRP